MVIIQQIYRRFVLGQTTNPQFAGFGQAVALYGRALPPHHRSLDTVSARSLLLIRHGQASFRRR
jgi:hypothetical protein